MAIATITLTGNIHDIVGADVDTRRASAWIVPCDANGPIQRIVDPVSNEERYGNARATINADGSYAFTNLWPTNAATNPTGFYYEVFIEYTLKRGGRHSHGSHGHGNRDLWRSGPFALVGSGTVAMADLDLDTPAVSATWRSAFRTAMDDALAYFQSRVITDLETSDGQMKALIETPASQTAQALSDTFAARDAVPLVVGRGGLLRWKTRLASATTSRVPVLVIGSSSTLGAWADDGEAPTTVERAQTWSDAGYVGRLRAFFASIYSNNGEGFVGFSAEEHRWTLSGTNALKPLGVASTGRRWTGSGSASGTFTGTGFDVIGVHRSGAVGGGQPLVGGGVPLLFVDGTEVTPDAINGSPEPGVPGRTGGWLSSNGTLSYTTELGARVITHTTTTAGGVATYTPGSAGPRFPVTPGTKYLLSAEVYAVGFQGEHSISTIFYDATGTSLGETSTTNGRPAASTWFPITSLVTAPANAATAAIFLRRSSASVGQVVKYRRIRYIPLQWSKAALGDGEHSTQDGPGNMYRYGVDGFTNAPHSVMLAMSGDTSGTTDVTGIRVRNGSATSPGVVVHRLARSGSATVEHVGGGWSAGTKADLLDLTMTAVEEAPALVVFALGANDWNRQDSSGLDPATFEANMQILIAKAVGLGASVLLTTSPMWEDDTKTHKQSEYADVLRNIAATSYHVAFFDLAQMWGDFADADGKGYMYDSPHPNATGHRVWARDLVNILAG